MNIQKTPFIAIAIAAITIISLAIPAWSATAPGTAQRKHDQAAEAFKLEISKVYVEEADGPFKDVIMEAKVIGVIRTACGVKAGETIVIKSRRRFMTNEQLRESGEGFNEAPLVIQKGWAGTAYLLLKDATNSSKTFGVVLEGFSFVAEGAQNSENDKPDAGQAGTGQAATRPESMSEGGDKPQPEAEVAPR